MNGKQRSSRFIAAVLTGVFSLAPLGCAREATAEKSESAQKSKTAAVASAAAKTARSGHDWPRFLGPSGFGHSTETGLLQKWPKNGPPLIWEKKIGSGYSAPSIRGNRLVMHHRIGNEEIVDCLKADSGERLWRHKYPSHYSDPYGYNNGPRCTPLLTKNRCYTFGAEGKLVCLDLQSGKRIWLRDCLKDFNLIDKTTMKPNWFFGVGCTPILEGDLLIVMVGGQPNSGVVAFDAKTGKTVWENVGKKTWDGVEMGPPGSPKYQWTGSEQIIGYSSPIAVTIHGKRHVLCFGRQGLVSLNPQNGRLNFKHWFRSTSFESVNAARPLVVGDKIFLSVAYRQGSTLLQVDKDGKSFKVLWRNRRNMLTHWSTAMHVDGFVYGFSGRHEREGSFRCLDFKTGKVQWLTSGFEGSINDLTQDPLTGAIKDKKTGEEIPWPFFGRGSKLRVGDQFIVLGERGTLSLVKINPKKFEEISRTSYKQIGYPAWSAPVLSRKRLYLRDENALICLDLAPPAKAKNGK
ncbi:MAG: PQQ-binding-like beta-propeller repeat protein [Planctomycetes bacterium]|nr:PQQ-binding-like beta-propeller repeat protein [Planctomycetota bacterium]